MNLVEEVWERSVSGRRSGLFTVLLIALLLGACQGPGRGKESDSDTQESQAPLDSSPGIPDSSYEDCDNEEDDDGDGLEDELDVEDCDDARPEDAEKDLDGDGYAAVSPDAEDDCDDADPRVNPGAVEICDGIDNDCDDAVDEADQSADHLSWTLPYIPGCTWYLRDADGDGFGDEAGVVDVPVCSCDALEEGSGWVLEGGDCDDASEEAGDHFPEAAIACDGWPDDNCDGLDDDEEETALEECELEETFCGRDSDCGDWYADEDGDGEGDGEAPRCYCASELSADAPDGHASSAEDCDDDNADWWYITMYTDDDQDGFGDAEDVDGTALCVVTHFYAPNNEDCDDSDPEVNPGATEDCETGADEDCDGLYNEEGAQNCLPFPVDNDEDGYGSDRLVKCLCEDDETTVDDGGTDCDDADPEVNPSVEELRCDAKDNDCDNTTPDEESDETTCDSADNDCDTATGDDPDGSCP